MKEQIILARIRQTAEDYKTASLGGFNKEASEEDKDRWYWMHVAVHRVLREVESVIGEKGR